MTTPVRASESTLIEIRQALMGIEQNRRKGGRHDFDASGNGPPPVTDDESAGWSAGSMQFFPDNDTLWICDDATKGAASWLNLFEGDPDGGIAGSGHNFKHIEPPDSNTLTADVKGDTLTVADGGGMTITGTSATDTLTLAVTLRDLFNFFNGTFLESFDALVTESGGTITMTLTNSNDSDLTMVFSDGLETFSETNTIALTAGADDENPQANYIYILKDDDPRILVKSTVGWPGDPGAGAAAEHIKIGYFLVPSATFVNTNGGAYINQNWNDHASDAEGTEQGHLTHMGRRIRSGGAIWFTGCEGVATVDTAESPDAIWVSIASGAVSQMHPHTIAALDSDSGGAADPILVVNDNSGAYTVINDLVAGITADSTGAAIGTAKFFSVVIFVVANKTGEFQPIMLLLPSGTYPTLAAAQNDTNGYATYTMPREFTLDSSTGFLVAEFILKSGTPEWTVEDTIDLRGKTPDTASGAAGTAGDVTAAIVLTDNAIVRGDGGAKGVQTSGITIDDSNNMSGVGNFSSSGTGHDQFSDFVADEHIAHSGVTVTAGAGMTGGGTIDSTVTLNVINATNGGLTINAESVQLNINDLGTDTIASGDFIAFDDLGSALDKKITFANFEAALTHDNLVSGTIADHDTGATGAELDTLTDTSDADGLHTHGGYDTHVADTTNPHATDVDNLGSGTLAELSAAISDDTVCGIAAAQTLTNKALTTPTIGDLTNATHDHADAAGGGTEPRNFAIAMALALG